MKPRICMPRAFYRAISPILPLLCSTTFTPSLFDILRYRFHTRMGKEPLAKKNATFDFWHGCVEFKLTFDLINTIALGPAWLRLTGASGSIKRHTNIKIRPGSSYCIGPPFDNRTIRNLLAPERPIDLRRDIIDQPILDPPVCVSEIAIIICFSRLSWRAKRIVGHVPPNATRTNAKTNMRFYRTNFF